MATVNKDFKIKHGLVVEGTTATVNGKDILAKNLDSDQYIINLIGGETLITSVDANQLEVINGALSVKAGVFDAYGAAASAETNANSYTDDAIGNIDLSYTTDDVTEGTNLYFTDARALTATAFAYDEAGSAQDAEDNAKAYADGLAVNYDAAGAAGAVAGDLSTHEGLTAGVHGVTGSVVGTTDTQDLSNKRFVDTVYFTDGTTIANEGEIAVRAVTHDFDVQANYGALNLKAVATDADVNVSSQSGDIILNANGGSYIGSVAAANEIATKSYVDATAQGLDVKASVIRATTGPITLSGEGVNDDGNGYYSQERVLVKNQTTASENGFYIVNKNGTWDKASDDASLTSGSFTFVEEGPNAGKGFVFTGNYVWTQFSESGQYITSVGTELDVTGGNLTVVTNTFDAYGSASTALTNANSYTDTAVSTKADSANPTITGGLTVDGSGDFTIDADAGIILQAGTASYLTSATAGNEIATQGYVDDAIANAEVDYSGLAGNNINWTGTQFAVNSAGVAAELTTDSIVEGIGINPNLYFTDERAQASAVALLTGPNTYLTNIEIVSNLVGGLNITAENGVADSTTTDLVEGDNLYFTDVRAIQAVEGISANFFSVTVNEVAKQVAATLSAPTAGIQTAHAFRHAEFRSAEYLVKVAYGAHTEISKVLLTLDTSDNIAITEYGIVGTNGSASSVSAQISGTEVQLLVTTANNNSTVTVMGTLLV